MQDRVQDRLIQSWRDTVAELGRQMGIRAEEFKAGWPDSFKPERIAVLQRPYTFGDLRAKRLTQALVQGLNAALASGVLPSVIKIEQAYTHTKKVFSHNEIRSTWDGDYREPIYEAVDVYGDKDFHYITAPAFAAWLAAQHEEPSPHIQAWFDAVGVAAGAVLAPVAVVNTAPQDESIEDRDLRWLNHYEIEERIAKRGAYNRTAAHFGQKPATLRKAVDRARNKRTERNRAGLKTVTAKRKATHFSGLVTTVKDGKKTTKNQR